MLKCRAIPSILNQTPSQTAAALVLFLRRDKRVLLSAAAKSADNALGGLISEVVKRGDFSAKAGEVCLLHIHKTKSRGKTGFGFARVILAGFGESKDDTCGEDDGMTAAFVIAAKNTAKIAVALPDMPKDNNAGDSLLMRAVLAAGAASYQFKLGGHFPQKPAFDDIAFAVPAARIKAAGKVLTFARASAIGAMQARHLAEQPGNVCDPPFLAAAARAIAKKYNLRANVLAPPQLRKMKMNALLAVAAGSDKPAHLITLHHKGAGGKKNIALVGKGVTFDSGGISIKPAAAMDEMKFDMGGAASVLGAICAVAMLKMPLNVVAVVPTCENMPGGNATKPGDVITAMNGKSIEVLNTDAEGRLILADALTYTQKQFAPAVIIDAATLTGACVIALGHHISGMVSDSDNLAKDLTSAGEEIGDECWRLPTGARYQAQLKTDYADIANIGGRAAGTITAACFLSRFIDDGKDKAEWAHLDIAGTAWTTGKRATGRPVPLFLNYLRRMA
ncbi:MAG: leucyl aminopeptidase [Gammaproteobacteria bacterium]